MKNCIKVSIIIPIYKCNDYLEDCINSVCDQSFKDIEIICVLDGPDEKARKIIQEKQSKDNRIILVEQEHSNAGQARNAGLKVARGDYLSFLDADDLYTRETIEKLYNNSINNDADIAICGVRVIDKKDNITTQASGFNHSMFPDKTLVYTKDVEKLYSNIFCVCWNKTFKRSFVLDNGLLFADLNLSEDVFFVFTSLTCSKRLVFIKDDLIIHRKFINEDSITSSRLNYLEDQVYATKLTIDWLIKKGYWKNRGDDYLDFLRIDIEYHFGYGSNQKHLDELARYLCKDKPFKNMSNPELNAVLDFDIDKRKTQKLKVQDNALVLNKTNEQSYKTKIDRLNNQIKYYSELLSIMKEKYGRDLSKSNPFTWFDWSIRHRGFKATLRKMFYKIEGELDFEIQSVICNGFISSSKHYLEFFLPLKLEFFLPLKAKVIDLSIVVRCNGYYPLTVSGENKETLTPLGSKFVKIVSKGKTVRNKELTRVYADISPGLGIRFVLPFFNTLKKNYSGDDVDNNQPVSVTVNGKIKLK